MSEPSDPCEKHGVLCDECGCGQGWHWIGPNGELFNDLGEPHEYNFPVIVGPFETTKPYTNLYDHAFVLTPKCADCGQELATVPQRDGSMMVSLRCKCPPKRVGGFEFL